MVTLGFGKRGYGFVRFWGLQMRVEADRGESGRVGFKRVKTQVNAFGKTSPINILQFASLKFTSV